MPRWLAYPVMVLGGVFSVVSWIGPDADLVWVAKHTAMVAVLAGVVGWFEDLVRRRRQSRDEK